MKQAIVIRTPFIRLDAALKLAGAAATGGQAKALVQAGQVNVNGQPCRERGKKLTVGTVFTVEGDATVYTVTGDG